MDKAGIQGYVLGILRENSWMQETLRYVVSQEREANRRFNDGNPAVDEFLTAFLEAIPKL